MAQPPPDCAQGLPCRTAAIGQVGQHPEHRPDRECNARQRRRWRGAVDGVDDARGEQRADDGRSEAVQCGTEIAAAPSQHRPNHHRYDAGHQDRHEGRVEELPANRQLGAAPHLGEQRVEGAEEYRRHARAEQQIVEDEGAFAAHRSKRVAGFETGGAQRVKHEPAADHQRDQHQDEDAARRVDGEGVDRGQDAGAHEKGSDQAHTEGQDGEQDGPALQGLALFDGGRRVQQGGSEQPRHKGGVLDRVPIPPAAPAEHVIGPPAAHRDADRQPAPGGQCPGPHPAGPGGADPPLDQRGDRERISEREADIAEIEKRRVKGEARVLQ